MNAYQKDQQAFWRDKALLVEGSDDAGFFRAILKKIGIDGVQVRHYEGKDNFSAKFRFMAAEGGFRDVRWLGIVRDADGDRQAAHESVISTLKSAQVLHQDACNQFEMCKGRRVGILIVPTDAQTGMLEDSCLGSVRTHPIRPHLEQYFGSLRGTLVKRVDYASEPAIGVNYYPKNEAKAMVQAFLAGMHSHYRHLGYAAEAGCWDFDDSCMEGIRKFLRELFGNDAQVLAVG